MIIKTRCILLLIIIFIGSPVKVLTMEIYSFKKNNNSFLTGVIIEIEKNNAKVLNLKGEIIHIPINEINRINVYNTVHNPISHINKHSQIKEIIYKIYIENDQKVSFIGFPIQFLDKLVLFFDIQGNVHIHSLSQITKIRKYKIENNNSIKLKNYKSYTFSNEKIKNKGENKSILYPTKILNGKIELYEFFSNFKKGFRKFKDYNERTYFYAKPFLFDRKLKIGNYFLFKSGDFNRETIFNPYITYSNGVSYGFQSKALLGGYPCDWIPEVEPRWLFQSEVKSHFFNTTFISNVFPDSIAVGNAYYTRESDLNYDNKDDQGKTAREQLFSNLDPYMTTHINYIILLGVDYGAFSISSGMYYPIYAIRANHHFREILAAKNTPSLKFMYIKSGLSISGIVAYTSYSIPSNDTHKYIRQRYMVKRKEVFYQSEYPDYQPSGPEEDEYGYFQYYNHDDSPVRNFLFKNYFCKFNISFTDLIRGMQIGYNGVIMTGTFKEKFHATYHKSVFISDTENDPDNKNYNTYKNYFSFTEYKGNIFLYHDFNSYVAVRIFVSHEYNYHKYEFFKKAKTESRHSAGMGGSFEFVF